MSGSSSLGPSSVLVPVDDVAFREIDEEAVVLLLTTGTYFGLNGVATRAWTLLAEGRPLQDVQTVLAQEYKMPADVIERDLMAWVAQLLEKGLVRAT